MTKYYDCIGTEVKVGDSVVFAEDESMDLLMGQVSKLPPTEEYKMSGNNVFEVLYGGLIYRRFKSEICYITTLNELGE